VEEFVETRVAGEQMRQQQVANAVAGVAQMEIGRILHRLETTLGKRLLNLPPTQPQQRTDHMAMTGLDTRQTLDPRAVEEADEKGLYLIVAVVGGHDIGCTQLAPLGLEHFVSDTA
jgi:hypothetical protein